MIKVNGRLTSYTDTVESLIHCAQEHKGRNVDVYSTTGGRIQVRMTDGYTDNDFVIKKAKGLGLTVVDEGLLGAVIKL
jgi:hypothetical protein